jgi:RNA polymerase sigma factor (sigma-70 family)
MTAIPGPDIVGPTDAELAGAAAAGDRGAFAGIYDRYADHLHDFCIGMVRDYDAAADCVQDVFCTAATALPQLREPDKLRPWLYAIARNEALRRIRQRRREHVSDALPEVASGEPGPETLAARSELADLIAEAAGGLSDRDRSVLELAYRHGLEGPDLGAALGVNPTHARKLAQRLRETVERSLGALLVARYAQQNPNRCPELSAILDGWDGQFNILMRKRIARHIESCPTCEQQRRRLVNSAALLGAVPVFIPAPSWLRDQTLSDVRLSRATSFASNATPSETGSAPSGPEDHPDDAHTGRTRRFVRLGALVIATVITCLGLTIAWLHHRNVPVSATELTTSAPQPTNPTPAGPPEVMNGSPVPVAPPPATSSSNLPAATPPSTITVTTLAPASPPSTISTTVPTTVTTTVTTTVPTTVTTTVPTTVTTTVPTTVTSTVTVTKTVIS